MICCRCHVALPTDPRIRLPRIRLPRIRLPLRIHLRRPRKRWEAVALPFPRHSRSIPPAPAPPAMLDPGPPTAGRAGGTSAVGKRQFIGTSYRCQVYSEGAEHHEIFPENPKAAPLTRGYLPESFRSASIRGTPSRGEVTRTGKSPEQDEPSFQGRLVGPIGFFADESGHRIPGKLCPHLLHQSFFRRNGGLQNERHLGRDRSWCK